MKDVNKVILVGRLGGDPIQRQTKGGTAVVHFSVATSRKLFREGTENQSETTPQEETQWHKVVVWGRQGETCAHYLKKGNTVYVEGFIKSHTYEGKEGSSKLSFEIHADTVSFLGGGGGRAGTTQTQPQTQNAEVFSEQPFSTLAPF